MFACVMKMVFTAASRHMARAELFLTDEYVEFCVTGQNFWGMFVYADKHSDNKGSILLLPEVHCCVKQY